MKIPLILNESKLILTAEPTDTLLHVLRKEKIYSVKCGCEKGICGNCMVLLDDSAVPSCKIPMGIIRDCRIETLEHLKNKPEYQDIMSGFSQAGVHMCGYCNSGKILTAYSIITQKIKPNIEQIQTAIKNLDSCCTDYSTLTNGILYAVANKHSREGKKLNGKK